MKRPAATFIALLISFAALYAVFLAREFAFIKEQGILPNMIARWHFLQAFISCMEWAPLVQAAVILVSFGLFKDDSQMSDPASSLLKNSRGMMVVIFVMFAAFSFLVVFGAPDARKEDGRIRRASATFAGEIEAVIKALDAKRWEEASAGLDVCAIIDRNDKRYIKAKGRYDKESVPEAAKEAVPETTASRAESPERTANAYFLEARKALSRGDLYTAHSLATKAYRIDSKRLDAQRLASEIWNSISTMQEGQTEKGQREIAREKMEAYKRLQNGDPVEAYSLFLELKKKAPKDADIEEYLKESLEEAKGISFFKDEVTRLSRFPSARNVFFRYSAENGAQNFLACEYVYFGIEQAYLSGVEYLGLNASGKILVRFTAPFAKFQVSKVNKRVTTRETVNGEERDVERDVESDIPRLLLACYDKKNPKDAFLPVFQVKEKGMLVTNFIDVPFRLAGLKLAAIAASDPGEATLPQLDSIRRGSKKIGADSNPFINEGLMRIQTCLAFLLISLLCLYLGNRFRYKGSRKPLVSAIVAFPISIFVAGILLQSWTWFNRTIISILVRDVSAASIPVFIAIQAAALALAFVILAGYRDAPSD